MKILAVSEIICFNLAFKLHSKLKYNVVGRDIKYDYLIGVERFEIINDGLHIDYTQLLFLLFFLGHIICIP